MLRLKKRRDKPVGHGNPSPRKLTRELSVRSAGWTTVIVPSIYYWRNSPQTVILPLSPVGTDPKRSGRLIAQKLPLPPMPFLSEMRPSAASTFVRRVFDPLNYWVLGLQVCIPTPVLLSFVLFVLFFWLLGMVPAGQALCQIHPNTRPGNFYQGYGKLWAGCVAW